MVQDLTEYARAKSATTRPSAIDLTTGSYAEVACREIEDVAEEWLKTPGWEQLAEAIESELVDGDYADSVSALGRVSAIRECVAGMIVSDMRSIVRDWLELEQMKKEIEEHEALMHQSVREHLSHAESTQVVSVDGYHYLVEIEFDDGMIRKIERVKVL